MEEGRVALEQGDDEFNFVPVYQFEHGACICINTHPGADNICTAWEARRYASATIERVCTLITNGNGEHPHPRHWRQASSAQLLAAWDVIDQLTG